MTAARLEALVREVQPLRAVAGLARATLAGRLVVAGALAAQGQVPRRRESGHVGADLGEDALGAASLDADDRAQQLNRRRERADLVLDRVREPLDLLVEEIDVREDRPDPQSVV